MAVADRGIACRLLKRIQFDDLKVPESLRGVISRKYSKGHNRAWKSIAISRAEGCNDARSQCDADQMEITWERVSVTKMSTWFWRPWWPTLRVAMFALTHANFGDQLVYNCSRLIPEAALTMRHYVFFYLPWWDLWQSLFGHEGRTDIDIQNPK